MFIHAPRFGTAHASGISGSSQVPRSLAASRALTYLIAAEKNCPSHRDEPANDERLPVFSRPRRCTVQRGSVIQTSRKEGPDVWQFRWSEKDMDGQRVYRKRVIGTVEQYADATAARHAASCLISQAQLRSHKDRIGAITLDQLCEHFEESELRSGASLWSIATQKTYRGYIRRWVRPRWGSRLLHEVKAADVEVWLSGLELARGSRAKIRNVLCVLFNHACRHELFDHNPIRFVRQSAKRRRAPDVLTGTAFNFVQHCFHAAQGPNRSCGLFLLVLPFGRP
jgi:hypothetical protein